MSRVRSIVEIASTVLVSGVALVVATVYLLDRARPRRVTGTPPASRYVETWQADNRLGIRLGSVDARVVITEFMDFQCPFCRRLVPAVDSMLSEFPNDVAVVFQHFPLATHSLAIPAAIAAECAAEQGRFREMYRELFAKQDQIGNRNFVEYAQHAGVPDAARFERCAMLPVDSFPRIGAGLEIGARTGVRGTPTTWINGQVQRFSTATIRQMAQELQSGG